VIDDSVVNYGLLSLQIAPKVRLHSSADILFSMARVRRKARQTLYLQTTFSPLRYILQNESNEGPFLSAALK